MNERDLMISRRMPDLAEKVDALVARELGERHMIALVIQPAGPEPDVAELHYISNAPREFMREAFRSLVAKWDGGHPDIPPHAKQ